MGNRVDIVIEGPVKEDLARVVITDDFETDTFYVANGDVVAAREAGPAALLSLLVENAGGGKAILSAAVENHSTVRLEGDDLDDMVLHEVSGAPGNTLSFPAA